MLTHEDMLKLKRWNTPTIYNGWEAITQKERLDLRSNQDETRDFMPQMGPMIGYAITVTCQPGNKENYQDKSKNKIEYQKYVASLPGPKIVVLQDLDSPGKIIGSFWGEVSANVHRALGCIGTISEGAIRDVDEMTNAGFKALARRLCVGHAYTMPISWGEPVTVFGCEVRSGDLIHADKHGFMVIPEEDHEHLVEAVAFMDENECRTTIDASRQSAGKSYAEILSELDRAGAEFGKNVQAMKNTFGL